MHKPNAPVAPPSYSEVIGQSMSTTNAPVRTQCEYPDPSQSFNYPPPGMAYPYPSNSYSGMPYNPSYISANQPCTPYVISATVVAAEDNAALGKASIWRRLDERYAARRKRDSALGDSRCLKEVARFMFQQRCFDSLAVV
jgi:hypothetical protein